MKTGINRMTTKSAKNTRLLFDILKNEKGDLEYMIRTRYLLCIDDPRTIQTKALKPFKNVVLCEDMVVLTEKSMYSINFFFNSFHKGDIDKDRCHIYTFYNKLNNQLSQ